MSLSMRYHILYGNHTRVEEHKNNLTRNIVLNVLSFSVSDTNKLMAVASFVLAFIIIDLVFSYAASTIRVASNWEIALFIVVASVYGIGQYLILDFVRHKSKQIRNKIPLLNALNTFMSIVQYILIAIIVSLIVEVIFASHFHTAFLNWGSTISYAIAAATMGILALRFLLWYQSSRSFVVLSYGVASTATSLRL